MEKHHVVLGSYSRPEDSNPAETGNARPLDDSSVLSAPVAVTSRVDAGHLAATARVVLPLKDAEGEM